MGKSPTRLAGPAQIATGPATIYTVPALTLTIVRQIHIQNPSGSAVTFTLSIGADAAALRLWDAFSVPAAGAGVNDSVRDFFMYMVLATTEIVQVAAGTNNILTITLFGDEFTL